MLTVLRQVSGLFMTYCYKLAEIIRNTLIEFGTCENLVLLDISEHFKYKAITRTAEVKTIFVVVIFGCHGLLLIQTCLEVINSKIISSIFQYTKYFCPFPDLLSIIRYRIKLNYKMNKTFKKHCVKYNYYK